MMVRGVVTESLDLVEIQKVAYLSIDMHCTFPEIEALEHHLAENDRRWGHCARRLRLHRT